MLRAGSPERGAMADWQKTQYRLNPPPEYLGDAEDMKFGLGGWLVILLFVGCVGYLALWAFGIL